MTQVIFTRPLPPTEGIAEKIHGSGYELVTLPLLNITPINTPSLPDLKSSIWIFISPNAAHYAFSLLEHQQWRDLSHKQIFAIGHATADRLAQSGIISVTVPTSTTSEGLLALATLQAVENKRIILVCGKDGRDLIQTSLEDRGAQVSRWEVYQREPIALSSWRELSGQIESNAIWLLTSESAIKVLGSFISAQRRSELKVIVSSSRLASIAKEGLMNVIAISQSAHTEDLLTALFSTTKEFE